MEKEKDLGIDFIRIAGAFFVKNDVESEMAIAIMGDAFASLVYRMMPEKAKEYYMAAASNWYDWVDTMEKGEGG